MHRRFKQVFTSLKERGTVKCAKIATIGGFSNLEFIIIKATPPDDLPLPEKYIQELLKIFSISQTSFRSFSVGFIRRFENTKCWKVALKCLLLLHKLLRLVPQNSTFRSELLWARSNGFLSLYPCHFQDESSSNCEYYTAFIKSYAQFLDESLVYFSLSYYRINANDVNEEESEGEVEVSLFHKMKEANGMLELLPQLQSLIDRVMDCRPIGLVAKKFIVQMAMKHLIRDSFMFYIILRKEIVVVMDNLFQMPFKNCMLAFGIYKKAAKQANQLCEFYEWCQGMGLCGTHEYPFVDRIPHIQVKALENFLDGMWQFTDSSSTSLSPSLSSSLSSPSSSPSLSMVDDHGYEIGPRMLVGGHEEVEALIQMEDDVSWETLLDSSVNLSPNYQQSMFLNGFDDDGVQVVNPFNNPRFMKSNYQGYIGFNNTTYPWGL